MDALQVAIDYCSEEGFDFTKDAGGEWVEVRHPKGAAKVHKDSRVESASNPRLKEVLEKKLALARAKETQLLEDPEGRVVIKFSANYEKMPADVSCTRLLGVLKVKRGQLSAQFLEYDTKFLNKPGNFPLSSGPEFLVLLLLSEFQTFETGPEDVSCLWTTIRAAWPPEKEEFYRSHVGEYVNIQIEGGKA